MWSRLRTRLLALAAALAAGGTFATYWASMDPADRTLTEADLTALVAARPGYAPLVASKISGITIDCWKVGEEIINGRTEPKICRHGKLYAAGEGGETNCTGVPGTDTPWPCDGNSHDWARLSRLLIDADDEKQITEVLLNAVRQMER
jgi:hypothetical protein